MTTTMVFIHGVGLDQTMWNPIRAIVESHGHAVVSYDMLGHGGAAALTEPTTLHAFVDQLAEVVASRAPGPVDVIGFSMGALVAQSFAETNSASIRRLALLHGVFDRSIEERAAILDRVQSVRNGGYGASIEAALERWFTPAFASSHAPALAAIRSQMERNNVLSYSYAYAVFATADAQLVEHVESIRCPTLVMTGADDPRSTPEMSTRLSARLSRATLVVLPGLRHMAPVEAPDVVAAHLLNFFGEP